MWKLICWPCCVSSMAIQFKLTQQVTQASLRFKMSQNRDIFTYDNRGRLYRQTRLIDNRSYVMETTNFDALNRPLTIKYPTNKIVAIAYDQEGKNSLTAGSSQLVSDMGWRSVPLQRPGPTACIRTSRCGQQPILLLQRCPHPNPAGSGNNNFLVQAFFVADSKSLTRRRNQQIF